MTPPTVRGSRGVVEAYRGCLDDRREQAAARRLDIPRCYSTLGARATTRRPLTKKPLPSSSFS